MPKAEADSVLRFPYDNDRIPRQPYQVAVFEGKDEPGRLTNEPLRRFRDFDEDA
jgi:hypothetical protein